MNFDAFMAKVNRWLIALSGLDADMLPDYGYYDAWSRRKTPEATARAALRYAREYC